MFNVGAVDLGFNRKPFTWCNKREGTNNIRERLDRAMASTEWRTSFDQARVVHLSNALSDHIPLQLNLTLDHPPKSKPFRFLEIWTRDPRCRKVVHDAWTEADLGNRAASIRYKLHSIALALKDRNKNVFGFYHTRVSKIEEKIKWIQG